MAILKQVWNARLSPARGVPEATTVEFAVVREDRNPELLFSIMENQGPVRRRLTFALTTGQALGLARFLAGVSTLSPALPDPEEDDEGDRTPTKPGIGRPVVIEPDPVEPE